MSHSLGYGQSSAVAELASIFRSEWVMVVFYGDESGTHGEGDYVISGYLSHKSTWDFFSKVWREALHAPTPRRIEYMKMSEWEHRDPAKGHSGQFLGWTNADADIKLSHMISVLQVFLKNGSIAEFTSSISWDLYRRYVDGYCLEVFDNPYYFNLRQVTLQAVQIIKKKDPAFSGKIHYVFDQGNSAEKNAPKHFGYTKLYAEPEIAACMGPISFVDDKDEPGLQAADLIAWHTRRHLTGIDPVDDVRERDFEVLRDFPLSYCREAAQEDALIVFNVMVNQIVALLKNRTHTGGGE